MGESIGKELAKASSFMKDYQTCSLPIFYIRGDMAYPAVFSFTLSNMGGRLWLTDVDTLFYIDGEQIRTIDLKSEIVDGSAFSELCKNPIERNINLNYSEFIAFCEILYDSYCTGDYSEVKTLMEEYVPSMVLRQLYSLVSPEYISELCLFQR